MEPTIGIEPMDLFLTKEALYRLSYVGTFRFRVVFVRRQMAAKNKAGAGDEARTRDIQLGRLKLYQLSYSRISTKQQPFLSPTFTPSSLPLTSEGKKPRPK
jgi:hypothetical protein